MSAWLRGMRSSGTAAAVVGVWLSVAALVHAPFLKAELLPPPGLAFVGAFHWIDDFYNYLSFVQQAEDGSFVFVNKLVTRPHPPALVNVEWWLAGSLSRLLGRHPVLAFRLLGLLAALGLVAGVDRWLRRAGLPASHRVPALVLVSTGGGLGWLLWRTGSSLAPLDLAAGLFPFLELLANPHFVFGTALLTWCLLLAQQEGWASATALVALGSVLGTSRPYDLVLLAGVRVLACLPEGPRSWPRRLLPLLGFLPVVAYCYWVFYRNPSFAFYTKAPYVFPTRLEFLAALGPAALLACLALRQGARNAEERAARRHLWAWVLIAGGVIALRPVFFSLQFLVGIGLPLLSLGALGLSRLPARALWVATGAFAGSLLATLGITFGFDQRWFVSRESLAAVEALRPACRSGDLALSPPRTGLLSIGLTSCKAFVSHRIMPDYEGREAAMRAFYDPATTPSARGSFLDRECIRHVFLANFAEAVPSALLGEATPFRRASTAGATPRAVSVYSSPPSGCLPPR